jgi:hypothetical protein
MMNNFFGVGNLHNGFCKGLLVFLIAIAFHSVLRHDFVSWDDNENYRQNDVIKRGLSKASMLWAISDGTLLGVYEPTAIITKLTIVSAGRLVLGSAPEDPISPQPFIAFSLCLHCLNSLAVFDICPGFPLSKFLASLIFAV